MTRHIVMLLVAGALLVATTAVYAGQGCCLSKTKAAQTETNCMGSFAGLQLSDEQKTKLAAVSAECAKSGCSQAAHAKCAASAKEILTPEQFSQWKAQCDKMRKSGRCPFADAEKSNTKR